MMNDLELNFVFNKKKNKIMKNNDILRRLRYAFDFSDSKMIQLFGLGGAEVTREQISDWLKKEEDPSFDSLFDIKLATFLNGFIIDRRGAKDGELPKPEKTLNNNLIFRKLKIALNLREEDILAIFELVGMNVSKHEISAFFRKPDQNQYRLCKDQILRNFIQGVQLKYRVTE
jgi:uncharacterized protein YehS (DUF1456 family)